jgi:hypothetical protein
MEPSRTNPPSGTGSFRIAGDRVFPCARVRRRFDLLVAGAELLFTGGLGNALIVERGVASGMNVFFIQAQLVAGLGESHGLAAGKDFMASVLFIPLGGHKSQQPELRGSPFSL